MTTLPGSLFNKRVLENDQVNAVGGATPSITYDEPTKGALAQSMIDTIPPQATSIGGTTASPLETSMYEGVRAQPMPGRVNTTSPMQLTDTNPIDFQIAGGSSAGIAHAMSGVPEDDYRLINTEATIGLARAARRAGAKRDGE